MTIRELIANILGRIDSGLLRLDSPVYVFGGEDDYPVTGTRSVDGCLILETDPEMVTVEG